MPDLVVSGIVAYRDKQPYVDLLVDGVKVAQLSIADAQKIALDMLRMAYRTEADAMIHSFFAKEGFPEQAGAHLMKLFREFRSQNDNMKAEGFEVDPETGERA